MSERVEMIEYRLIRPDGKLLWHAVRANHMGPQFLPIGRLRQVPEGVPDELAAFFAEATLYPPWVFQSRAPGGDWELIRTSAP